MNIGQASAAFGVSAEMIRYCASIDLIPEADRTSAGYRLHSAAEQGTLRFIRRARDLGMPVERIRLLPGLRRDDARSGGEVKRVALERVAELRGRIAEPTAICEALEGLAQVCHDDCRPECPLTVTSRQKASGRPPGRGRAGGLMRIDAAPVFRHRVEGGAAPR